MRSILGAVVTAAIVGMAAPASAHWQGSAVAPPGYPWAACSALDGCAGPLYTRRLVRPHVTVVRRHKVVLRRQHARPAPRYATRIVHHRWKAHRLHAGYAIGGGFQYIDDPQLAAVLAWGDIVNSTAARR